MDTRDGRIYSSRLIKSMEEFEKNNSPLPFLIPMEIPPTEKQMARRPPRVGRNEPCPCGSGKKFKKCCLK